MPVEDPAGIGPMRPGRSGPTAAQASAAVVPRPAISSAVIRATTFTPSVQPVGDHLLPVGDAVEDVELAAPGQ
jgi:hypothetical protein